MASARQIAANRRNATKSTGPRSGSGKRTTSRNAHRHGLSLRLSGSEFAKQVEVLAGEIAGRTRDAIALEHARIAAEAELELARVRGVRLTLIERVTALGSLKPTTHFRSANDEVDWLIAMDFWMRGIKPRRPAWPPLQDPAATMPPDEPDRSSEAVRRLLPELIKLDRYERRAVSRRDRAIRQIIKRTQVGI